MSRNKQVYSGVHLKNGSIAMEQEPIGPPLNPVQSATVSKSDNGSQCQDLPKTKKSRVRYNEEQLKLLDKAFREFAGYPPKFIITQLSEQMGIPEKSIYSHIVKRRYSRKKPREDDYFKIKADPQLNYKFNEFLDPQNPNGFVQYSDPSYNFDKAQATQNPNGLVYSSNGVQDTQNSNNGFAHLSHGDIFERASHPSYNFGEAKATQNPNDLVPLSGEIHASQNPNDIRYLSHGTQATQNPNGLKQPSHEIQVSQSLNDLVHSSHSFRDTQNPNNGFIHSSHGNIFEHGSHPSYNFDEVQATNNCFEYQNLNGPLYPSMGGEIALGVKTPDFYTMQEDEDSDAKKCIADVWDQCPQLPDTSTQPVSQYQQYKMASELHEWLGFLSYSHRAWYE